MTKHTAAGSDGWGFRLTTDIGPDGYFHDGGDEEFDCACGLCSKTYPNTLGWYAVYDHLTKEHPDWDLTSRMRHNVSTDPGFLERVHQELDRFQRGEIPTISPVRPEGRWRA